ncbi:MAG: PqqD family protein [Candidatus Acidiferrales bacterium]
MMNLQSYPQRKEQVIAQKTSSDFLLFDINDGNYYSLNEVGCRIWELSDGNHSIAQLIETLVAEYDAPAETLAKDALELLEKLRSGKLIVETARTEPLTSSRVAR